MSIVAKLLAKAARKEAEAAAARGTSRSLAVPRPAPRPAAPPPLAVKPKPKALPAPPKRLALPPPDPARPTPVGNREFKPRGGQWMPNARLAGDTLYKNYSPEAVAGRAWEYGPMADMTEPEAVALGEWWKKAVPKYLKNDFGTENDPIGALFDQGLGHYAGMQRSDWNDMANHHIMDDDIGFYTVPPHANYPDDIAPDALSRESLLAKAPWLAKAPVTDRIYGFSSPQNAVPDLGLDHILDETRNLLEGPAAGIPADLAVRPEMLQRMSFPQLAERVGRLNQWRQDNLAEANLSAQANPALHTFKEYPENNPRGLRWVQLAPPKYAPDNLPEGYSLREMPNNNGGTYFSLRVDGEELGHGQTPEAAIQSGSRWIEDDSLAKALQYEGDTMGHCVGGYCDDVTRGSSNIYSLRDAKGEPHVTIETAPRGRGWLSGEQLDEWEPGLFAQYQNDLNARAEHGGDLHKWLEAKRPDIFNMQDIVQIKGKANRAPVDEYLPFVQDFVKSGKWGQVGDLGNTGLTSLPDGRYITNTQWQEGARNVLRQSNPQQSDDWLDIQMRGLTSPAMVGSDWEKFAPHFEGFAAGGRVSADRCFCNNPLSVRRG